MGQMDSRALLLRALEQAAGPALVLDEGLRITYATPQAGDLLGGDVPLGIRAPQVLCGEAEKRPIAEALARGEPAHSEIVRLTVDGEIVVSVRTVPLFDGARLCGHLIFMAAASSAKSGVTELEGILTASENMRALLRTVQRVAQAEAPVLVRGETGSGKELVARAVHALSPRKQRPFAAINCAALPPQLLESELFGHVRGAFTGAVKDHEGHFRRVDGGTLFLDEVAELPLEVQAKLLRVTQEKAVLPVGGSRAIPVDVRLVSATHRSLRNEVELGRFRADLMYRLRVLPVFLPPLRERPADIEILAWQFLDTLHSQHDWRRVERIAPGALAALRAHSFPGNVRELQNMIEYAYWLGEGPVLSEAELPAEIRGEEPARGSLNAPPARVANHSPEAERIARALERASGTRERAAGSLGVSRSTLWRKMKKYGLEHLA
jgi:transcriptional regulator with PAS, ATPase and Fis domain